MTQKEYIERYGEKSFQELKMRNSENRRRKKQGLQTIKKKIKTCHTAKYPVSTPKLKTFDEKQALRRCGEAMAAELQKEIRREYEHTFTEPSIIIINSGNIVWSKCIMYMIGEINILSANPDIFKWFDTTMQSLIKNKKVDIGSFI